MKIEVIEIIDEYVLFTCAVGSGIGKCVEKNLIKGHICDVEIDLNAVLRLGKNAWRSSGDSLYIKNDGDTNLINGLVESIDNDDIICLRLASDCIIILEYEDCEISAGDGLLINIEKAEVEITLTGI